MWKSSVLLENSIEEDNRDHELVLVTSKSAMSMNELIRAYTRLNEVERG